MYELTYGEHHFGSSVTDQRPTPPNLAAHETAALRQTGASPLRVGDPGRVGPYVPLALLGSGGMGRVYLARAADDGPGLFAVKVIRPEYAEDVRFQRRFEREAAVHARLGPPYAPKLCGTGFEDELLWMATEYIPGLDLMEAVRGGGALPAATVWRLTADLGRALRALSAAGVVHRDLKPSNVLLSVQGTRLIDFGISKAADASALTGTGNRVGTAAYMSPEYLRTGQCDTASDVFSLAGTLTYAATGRAPFGDGTGVDVMHRVAFEEPHPEVTGVLSAADPELAALLSRCLAKEPGLRPSPAELIEAAEPHAGASGWPEPLLGEVLARQGAYETLTRLPVERAAVLRPADNRAAGAPTPPPGPVSRPAPAGVVAPSSQAAPEPAGRLAAAGSRPWVRRKRVLAVVAGTSVCAVAAGAFVLTRQHSPATGASPGTVTTVTDTAPGARPGNAGLPRTGGAPAGPSAEGASSGRAVAGGGSALPEPSASVTGGGLGDAVVPSGGTASATAPAGSSTSPAADPADQPWNTDCTYYAGYGAVGRGDSGKKVTQAQCMLTERGYSVGTDTEGDFGPGTESAVRDFQNAKGLTADGVVDRGTWGALRADA